VVDTLIALQLYLTANALLLVVWGVLAVARLITHRARRMSFASQLALGYVGCIAALVMPASGMLTSVDYLPQAAQIWTAPTMQDLVTQPLADHRVTIAASPVTTTFALDSISSALAFLLFVGFLLAIVRTLRGVLDVRRVIAASHPVRRRATLRILASDSVSVPFSFWIPGRHFIVVPTALLDRPHDFRIALRHEAQHHRQADTKMLYAFQVLLGVCFWNPIAYRMVRSMRELQEFACDEAIVGSRGTSASAYCRCLLAVAEHAATARMTSICVSMADQTTDGILCRRIDMLMRTPIQPLKRSAVAVVALAGLLLMSATSVALSATIKDRRISAADAQQMAQIARATSSFPIVVNDSVVQELNRYLGTPDGRAFVRDSLVRMQEHREAIGAKLTQYGLPSELLAVPLVESGYQNLPPSQKVGQGAGLWMFIARTARKYSLRVDERHDDRLNVAAQTDAAMRMFSELHQHFGDWGLAILAYNSGNAIVEQGIRETGSRDVWNIVGSGYENERDYMPRVMAAILIMQNPEYLKR
jgi:beta-lactamase regulating signal transducer with metallopeptidase domain